MADESVSATTVIDAPAAVIFAVLADPAKHAAIDGTGWVREALDSQPLTAAGETFRMAMYHENHPDGGYQMVNRVQVFDPPAVIAWEPGYETDDGNLSFGGWIWRYDLAPAGLSMITVTLSYDWVGGPRFHPRAPPVSPVPPGPSGQLAGPPRSTGHLIEGSPQRVPSAIAPPLDEVLAGYSHLAQPFSAPVIGHPVGAVTRRPLRRSWCGWIIGRHPRGSPVVADSTSSGRPITVRTDTESPSVCTVEVRGEIDLATADRLRDQLSRAIDGGARTVVVDLGDVQFLGSVGLSVLISAHKRLHFMAGQLLLRDVPPLVERVLVACGLEQYFRVVTSEAPPDA